MRIRAISVVLFCVAWLVQALAPVASAWAMARAADPFEHLVICSTLQTGQADDAGNGAPPVEHHDDCCIVCQAAAVAAPAPLIGATFVVVPVAVAREFAWTPYSPRAPPSHARPAAPPRGPPSLV